MWRIGRGRCRPGRTSLGSWTLRAVPEGRIQKPRPTPNRPPTWFCVALAFIAVLWSTPRLSSSASGQGSPRTACPTVSRQNLRPVSAALPRHFIFLSNDRPELGLHQDCREHRSWPSLCPPEPCGRVGGPWYEDALALPVLTRKKNNTWTSTGLHPSRGFEGRLDGFCGAPRGPVAPGDSASSFGGGQWSRGRDKVHDADPPCGFWHWKFCLF